MRSHAPPGHCCRKQMKCCKKFKKQAETCLITAAACLTKTVHVTAALPKSKPTNNVLKPNFHWEKSLRNAKHFSRKTICSGILKFCNFSVKKLLCEKKLNSVQLFPQFAHEIMIWPIRMQLMMHYRIPAMTESLAGKASNCFDSELV